MSKIADALRERGIFNTHYLLSMFGEVGRDYAICFTQHSRQTMTTCGVYLYSPRGRLRNHFSWNFKRGREEAKAYADQNFGITEWAVDPTDRSSLIPKYVRDAAIKFAKEPINDAPKVEVMK